MPSGGPYKVTPRKNSGTFLFIIIKIINYVYIFNVNIILGCILKISLLIKSLHLFLSSTGTLNQEESIECSDNQKEENIDKQENLEKSKGEIKIMAEENIEKEISFKKEVNERYFLVILNI